MSIFPYGRVLVVQSFLGVRCLLRPLECELWGPRESAIPAFFELLCLSRGASAVARVTVMEMNPRVNRWLPNTNPDCRSRRGLVQFAEGDPRNGIVCAGGHTLHATPVNPLCGPSGAFG